MADWKVVAEGLSLSDLKSIVADFELKKGDKLKVVMDLTMPLGWAFDAWGAELLFKPFIPEGMILKDVYSEDGQGIVDMEADPAWFLAALLFIKAHWLAIVIAGFVIGVIIATIIILVKIAIAPSSLVAALAIGGGLALIGVIAVMTIKKPGNINQEIRG